MMPSLYVSCRHVLSNWMEFFCVFFQFLNSFTLLALIFGGTVVIEWYNNIWFVIAFVCLVVSCYFCIMNVCLCDCGLGANTKWVSFYGILQVIFR